MRTCLLSLLSLARWTSLKLCSTASTFAAIRSPSDLELQLAYQGFLTPAAVTGRLDVSCVLGLVEGRSRVLEKLWCMTVHLRYLWSKVLCGVSRESSCWELPRTRCGYGCCNLLAMMNTKPSSTYYLLGRGDTLVASGPEAFCLRMFPR